MSSDGPEQDMNRLLRLGGFDARLSEQKKREIWTKLVTGARCPSRERRRRFFDTTHVYPVLRMAAVIVLVASLGLGIWWQKTSRPNGTGTESISSGSRTPSAGLDEDVRRLIAVLQQGQFEEKLEAAAILADVGPPESVEILEELSGDYYDHVPDNPFVRAAALIRARVRQRDTVAPKGVRHLLSPPRRGFYRFARGGLRCILQTVAVS